MYEYRHGGNVGFAAGQEKLVDLSANINPLGMPRGVRTAIIHDIPKCEAYPDSLNRELRTQIGLFEAVDPDWLFCGNGASDIIFRLPRAVQAKKVLVTAPAFSDYLRSCQSYGAQLIEHRLTLEKGFRVDDGLIAAVRHERPSLVFLCNPNNPTGV
ncbi:MAG: aminotransferase class I/II-fold pyridoxal phosphate-dependent enzyme, partial [Coriobacteriia bacterium]|nr:aminotransferase class I/II-fold pyridoxal phosphate-dependent enzyme [Coriobacteriia bacterium]